MLRALALVVVALPLLADAAAAPQPGRGERALRASFYLNTVPTLVELVVDLKKDVLEALELDAKQTTVIEKALATHWTEKKLYAHSSAALEKQLSAEVLDAAIAQMTPEVQAMVKAGVGEATPEQAEEWFEAAKKHPDDKAREALATRIAAHMPQPAAFKELLGQIAEVLADAAQVVTGNDDARLTLRSSLLEGMAPVITAMEQKETMVISAVIAYRDQPTPKLKVLADALDSEAGKKLQGAAPESLIAGAKQARADFVAQLKRELKPPKKK
jgi:hypothetical protein